METITRPKRYTLKDIQNKNRSNAWILLKIACILYSNKAQSIKEFTIDLLTYLYKFRSITEKQLAALQNIYINETILLENIKLDIPVLDKLSKYNSTYALNTLNASLPKLISTISSQDYNKKGDSNIQTTEKATLDPFEDKLLQILYNVDEQFSTSNRNTAVKVMYDYHLLGQTTKHMVHVIETIVPKGNNIKYKQLPKSKQLLDSYFVVYD